MKKSKTLYLTVICVAAVFFTSCDLVNSLFNNNNSFEIPGSPLLTTDADGHFLEDITYKKAANWNETYYSDGSFEENIYIYSTEDSETILYLSYKGSYSWDSRTLTLTKNITSYYSDGNWSTDISMISTEDFYFAESYHDVLFKKSADDENTWTSNEETVFESNFYSYTDQYAFENSNLIIEYSSSTTDIFGTTTYSSQSKRKYRIIDLFPAGTEWAEGNTVTFYLEIESYQTRSWNSETSTLGEWTDRTESFRRSLTMTHAGNFMIFSSAESTRVISGGLYE